MLYSKALHMTVYVTAIIFTLEPSCQIVVCSIKPIL